VPGDCFAYKEEVKPGTGREAGLGHVGERRERDAEASLGIFLVASNGMTYSHTIGGSI
jgi:hypothetical protein